MKLIKLNKSIIFFQNNAAKFLNGLTSNSIDAPHNALLTIHGMIIATFDQLKLNEDEVVAVFEPDVVPNVLSHLDRYMKLSGVKAVPLTKNIYFDLNGEVKIEDEDWKIEQNKGNWLITDRVLESNVSDEDFTLFRLQYNIPVQGIDYKDDFLLNVSESTHVSFTKGCFLGQEPVAKVHNRSHPTWKLIVQYEDECSQEEKFKMTSKAADLETGRMKGFVFVKNSHP